MAWHGAEILKKFVRRLIGQKLFIKKRYKISHEIEQAIFWASHSFALFLFFDIMNSSRFSKLPSYNFLSMYPCKKKKRRL